MKRPLDFIETDNIVIDVLNDMITNNTNTNDSINDSINKIRKISGLEANLDNMIKRMTRTNFALESKPDNVKKILRVSISYTYHQSDANDRSHYVILIEGINSLSLSYTSLYIIYITIHHIHHIHHYTSYTSYTSLYYYFHIRRSFIR